MYFIKLTPVQDQGPDAPAYCYINAKTIAVVSPVPKGSSILFQNDMNEVLLVEETPEMILASIPL